MPKQTHKTSGHSVVNLDALLSAAKQMTMTPEQQQQQRLSFAYGNSKIENNRISHASIARAAETLAGSDGKKH